MFKQPKTEPGQVRASLGRGLKSIPLRGAALFMSRQPIIEPSQAKIRLGSGMKSMAMGGIGTEADATTPTVASSTFSTESPCEKKDLLKSSKSKVKARRSLHKHLNLIKDDDHGQDNASAAADNEDQRVNKVKSKEGLGWYVYLIISADMRKTYVGVTTDFERRLKQHNGELNGGAKASRAGRPWQCVCLVHGFKGRSEACGFEWKWKYLSRNSSRKSRQFDNLNRQMGYLSSPLVEHRQAALDRVKESLDCQHLKIQWQGQVSSLSL